MIAGLGLLLGVLLGLVLQPTVPIWLQPYLPIAVVAALDAVFGALLPASGDAPRMAARLGLDATCASLEHASWYLRRGRDLAGDCPFGDVGIRNPSVDGNA